MVTNFWIFVGWCIINSQDYLLYFNTCTVKFGFKKLRFSSLHPVYHLSYIHFISPCDVWRILKMIIPLYKLRSILNFVHFVILLHHYAVYMIMLTLHLGWLDIFLWIIYLLSRAMLIDVATIIVIFSFNLFYWNKHNFICTGFVNVVLMFVLSIIW